MVFLALASAGASRAGTTRNLTVWAWVYGVDCLKTNLDEFNRQYPDIKVIFKTLAPGQIYLNLPGALSSGIGLPDVVALEDSHLPSMVATGGLLDLSDLAAANRGRFNAFKWAAVSFGGKAYAMPWDSGPLAVYYRRDVFARAGLPADPPAVAALMETWEDYCRTAKVIKEKTGSFMMPLSGDRNDGRLFEQLLQQQGLGYFDSAGRVALENPQAIKTLELLGRIYKDGLAHESVPWEEPWYGAIRDGTVATVIGAAYLDGFLRNWIAPQSAGQWGVAPLPAWSKGAGVRTSNDGGTSLAIPKRSKQTEAARVFVQFMLARKESQLNMLQKHDAFPALEDVYSDPYFDQPVPFYAGQAILRVFADLARDIPAWRYTEDYPTANAVCSAEIQAYLRGAKDAKTALSSAARTIRAKTKRP